MTTALIRDSNTVLNGQIASESALRNFATELSGFSTVLAGSDPDLRRLIETGSTSTIELRDFIETNRVELGSLFNNLVTTGNIIVKHLDGIKQVLVVYPYVVEGGFTVVSKSPGHRPVRRALRHDHHRHGAVRRTATAAPTSASRPTAGNRPMNEDARCTDPPSESNAARRPERPAPRGPGLRRPGRRARSTRTTGEFTWGDVAPSLESTGTVAPQTLGEESWKWLFLQPLTSGQE